MPIGTIVLGICLYALGGAATVWQFFVIVVLARAVSQPLLIGVVPRTLAVNFFLRRRNIALALAGMFRPIGSAINIQIISIIAVAQGWRAAFRYLSILSFLLTIPMVLIVRRNPEDIGLLPDGARPGRETPVQRRQPQTTAPGSAAERGTATHSQPGEVTWTAREAFRTKAYWIIAGSAMLGIMANSAIAFNTVPYLVEDSQLTTTQAAGVLSLGTLLSLSNLGWGYLADRFTPRRCMIWAMIIAAGSIVYLFTVKSAGPAYVFAVLWGISSGSSDALVAMVLAHYYGRGSYGTLSGAMRSFEAGGLGLGQGLGGIIYDLFGNYRVVLVTALMAHILSAILIFVARRPSPHRPMASSVPDEVALV
jgi:MFS family permease